MGRSVLAGFLAGAVASFTSSAFSAQEAADLEFFEKRVRPVLAERCYSCHGAERQRSALRLDSRAALLTGGERGPAVIPGDTAASLLMHAVSYDDVDLQMPPRGRLEDEHIAALREWIERGAPWPEEAAPEAAETEEEFDLAARLESHWCWQPIRRPPVPGIGEGEVVEPAAAVDAFLGAKLAQAQLQPASRADPATLLRRLTFSLVGLPPNEEQVAKFSADGPRYSEFVGELVDSDQYGVRWGRHWLDLVRYAETCGHEFDYPIPHAYQYRDYVVRAFNSDVPYDQLLREHLAGDLLTEPRRHPDQDFNESILATGFWYFHQATHAPVDVRQDEAERVDNQIDVFSKTFLGLTVSCARCHDHKFDAISTADFYALAGYLLSSRRHTAFLDPGREIERRRQRLVEAQRAGSQALADSLTSAREHTATALAHAQELVERHGVAERRWNAEDLEVLERSTGHWRVQSLGEGWTDHQHMWWTDAKPDDTLSLALPVTAAGEYEVVLAWTKARDYGRVEVLLDGETLGEVVDLYDPNVVPTGDVVQGRCNLEPGAHALQLRIEGKNEAALESYMVGVDSVMLRRVDPEWQQARQGFLAERAEASSLSTQVLERWADALAATADADNPGAIWRALDEARGSEETWLRAVAERFPDADQHREPPSDELGAAPEPAAGPRVVPVESPALPSNESELIADFDDGSLQGFVLGGAAFSQQPTKGGEWVCALGAERAATAGRGLLHSGLYGRKLQGSATSPAFVLTGKYLHYRVAGERCKIRVSIDGYTMDVFNGLLFNGVSFDVNTGGEWRWIRQGSDLSRFVGHRVHVEIQDEGDGWIAIDEIRCSDGPSPPEPSAPVARAIGGRLASTGLLERAPASSEALLGVVADALVHEGRDWLLGHGLAPMVTARLSEHAAAVAEIERDLPAPMRAVTMAEGTPDDEYVYVRGNHRSEGPIVPRRTLEAFGGINNPAPRDGSGRLELAESLLRTENPLVARVVVNRVWHHLFGKGLVESVDNFGVLGRTPSHPELLDWLADWFRVEAKYSLKALIAMLVQTEAWQRTSARTDAEAEERDPRNLLLHRQNLRRLESEAIRDAMLAASGRLDPKLGGPGVPVHLTPFLDGRGRPGGSGPLDGDGRRSLYQEVRRNFLPSMMLAFDFPLPFTATGARSRSNVPAQALVMMNDPFVLEQARILAEHVLHREQEQNARIELLCLRVYGRSATDAEQRRFAAFLQQNEGTSEAEQFQSLAHGLFNTKEFLFQR